MELTPIYRIEYFLDVIYESLIDGNVWSPESYPDGWEVIEE